MAAKKRHHRGMLFAGAGILAAAAAVGGTLLFGKSGTKNRKRVEGWVEDLKEDSVALLGDAKVLSRKAYNDAVDIASKKYKQLQDIDPKDIEKAVREVKGHWRDVEKKLVKTTKDVKRIAKKAVKKVKKSRRR